MTRHGRRDQAFATALATLAGFVDAAGFMATSGYFVSFMSGNSTRLGIGLSLGTDSAAIAGGLVGTFLVGVIVGALMAPRGERPSRQRVLWLVSLALIGSAVTGQLGSPTVSVGCMAFAMGSLNNTFARDGEVSIGVTYMTGSLVKLGQRIAAALLGRNLFGWLPYLLLWAGFVLGVVGGAVAYPYAGFSTMWGAATVAGLLSLVDLTKPED